VTGAVVLAAGASTRLGRPKQLLQLRGEALVRRAARVALEAGCFPVVVVEGAVPLAEVLEGLEVELARCGAWARGPGASLRCGVEALASRADGVVVLLADMPGIEVEDVRRLCAAPGLVAAAAHGEVLGVPARFSGAALSVLAQVPDERGAGPWLSANAARVTPVPMPRAGEDVDTPEDAAALGLASDGEDLRWSR
jgi:molybdenum cofactor cytidylyltransferase